MANEQEQKDAPFHFDTLGIHAGETRKDGEAKEMPIYASTSFVFRDSAHGAAIFSGKEISYAYSRIGNPTNNAVEQRITALEGGQAAIATASGQAALFLTITTLASNGDNILIASDISDLTSNTLFAQLHRFGIHARFIPSGNPSEVKSSIDEKTKAIFIESIPLKYLEVADIRTLSDLAHEAGVPLIVDNTYGAAGYLIRPFSHGADIVIQSLAPYLSITGANSAGIIIDAGSFEWNLHSKRFPQYNEPLPAMQGKILWNEFGKLAFLVFARAAGLRDTGPCLNPFEAEKILLGAETLGVRMERSCKNAAELAEWLSRRDEIDQVVYPGLEPYSTKKNARKYLENGGGGIIIINLKVGKSLTDAALESLKVITRSDSIGGSRTNIIPHDASYGAEDKDSMKNHIHISVGLENIGDLTTDFARLLSQM